MELVQVKKEFQKIVGKVRKELNTKYGTSYEYPKAMMTGQQIKKRTATINCSRSQRMACEVINHPAVIAFLRSNNAAAKLEQVQDGGWGTQHQVRIYFGGGNNDR